MVGPFVIATIFVDAHPVLYDGPVREIGKDDRDVPVPRDHRIGLVRVALEPNAGMRVNVGDDGATALAAHGPKLCEGIAMQNANAARVGSWIKLVVIDRARDRAATVRRGTADKKRP